MWDWGDARPLVVVNEATKHLERLVTFDKPRDYHVTLAAVNETSTFRKTAVVHSRAPRPRRERRPDCRRRRHGGPHAHRPFTLSDTFRPDAKGDVSPLSGRDLWAASSDDRHKEWTIRDVVLTGANGNR